MVKRNLFFALISLLLISCNNENKVEELNKETNAMTKEIVWTDEEKNKADKLRAEGLNKVEISEEGFLLITKYVIKTAKESEFNGIDLILGKKERMYSKDFKDPYISYHYIQIPHFPEIEVYLKYKKENSSLVSITIRRSGSAGGLSFKEYKLNTLDQLNLKVLKKSNLYYSNQIFEYQLTDGNFRYEVYGKDSVDNKPPKEFYDFRIYLE